MHKPLFQKQIPRMTLVHAIHPKSNSFAFLFPIPGYCTSSSSILFTCKNSFNPNSLSMADPIASSIVSTVLGNLTSTYIQNQIKLLCGFKDDLTSLKSTFSTIQCVLHDAEMKPTKSEALQNWLQKIRDAAYDVQDVLDDLRHKEDAQRGKSFLFLRKPLLFRFKMARKVKSVRTKLDAIAKERHDLLLREGGGEYPFFGVTRESRVTCSVMIEPEPCGRQEELENIIKKLLDDAHLRDDLSVFAIWGMGGIGKTTLAQMVCNDERIKNHFALMIWVCVLEDFNVERLVGAIIEKIDGRRSNLSELDALQCDLSKKLKGRFLLVLDDVWNENEELWKKLKSILRCDSKGSVLLVTTRKENVASMMETIDSHKIGCLNEDDSWSLFQRRAFSTGIVNGDLVSIGKRIVKKCGGVPLAINALSSMMSSHKEESAWLAIEKAELWSLLDNENDIFPLLKLSYYNLLPHMRQCFAYCSIFSKGIEMEMDHLIQLWMANDYIPCNYEEDVLLSGHRIFEELVRRCFFQDVKKSYKGKTICKMHDLMHDLAESVMRNETCLLEHEKQIKIPETPRHLSVEWIDDMERFKLLSNVESLRSIRADSFGGITFDISDFSFVSKQKYLRALDFGLSSEPRWLDLVWKLKHLKFLFMSCKGITRLPESLTGLYNLQTLKLTYSSGLVELPKNLKRMKKLVFLEMNDTRSLVCTPPGLGELTCLRELSVFIVGHDASQHINQLKDLSLEGDLTIKGLENLISLEDAESSNLAGKMNLTSLSLIWMENHNNKPPQHFEEVLEGLKPHHNIERVFIECYHGLKLANWMGSSSFDKLKEIFMTSCERCEDLLPFGNLPCLTHLRVQGCPSLYKIPCMPSLKKLTLYECNTALLTSIRDLISLEYCFLGCLAEVEILPDETLQGSNSLLELEISGRCIKSVSRMLDHLPSLKQLMFKGCDNLEVVPKGFSSLCSLELLSFFNCKSISTFPAAILEGLCSLKELQFGRCDELKPLSGDLKGTPPLRHLALWRRPELECLPESMQQLTSLKRLQIEQCEGLRCLPDWIDCLHSLSELVLWNCEELKCLPDNFKNLKSLRRLEIELCPELERRCKKTEGEDWPKISHIPTIRIGRVYVQQN